MAGVATVDRSNTRKVMRSGSPSTLTSLGSCGARLQACGVGSRADGRQCRDESRHSTPGGVRHISSLLKVSCRLILLAVFGANAQDVVTLEQAGSRNSPDFSAVYEGHTVTVRAQVASPPLWALGMYYLPLRDASEHGLILRG